MEKAGIDCSVMIVEDLDRIGWVAMHNTFSNDLDFDYYCYSCADYMPRQDYLALAIKKLVDTGKGLCAFNDGKWNGSIASVGVITKSYYERFGLFHDGYKSHGADDEITRVAQNNNEYTYEPLAFLEEIVGRKERENKNYNTDDQKLYYDRLESGVI